MIEAKVANALALDYPRELLEVIVASDGSSDRTVELARAAGADRGARARARRQGRGPERGAAERASGELLAFSDANASWHADALRELVAPFADREVGYACGQARFVDQGGSNQEGAYWRYEMAVRAARVRPRRGHRRQRRDLRGAPRRLPRRSARPRATTSRSRSCSPSAAGAPSTRRGAVAEEKMVATIEGEFARKRRMMRGVCDEVVRDGMLVPRGYGPLYAFEISSHRAAALRDAAPAPGRAGREPRPARRGLDLRRRRSPPSWRCSPRRRSPARSRARPLRLARYYVLVTASIAAGLWDRIRLGTPGAWEKAEGTR